MWQVHSRSLLILTPGDLGALQVGCRGTYGGSHIVAQRHTTVCMGQITFISGQGCKAALNPPVSSTVGVGRG